MDRNGKYHFSQTHFGQPFGKSLTDHSSHCSIVPNNKTKEKNYHVWNNSPSTGNTYSISRANSSVPYSNATDISSNDWEKFYSRITNKDRIVTPRTARNNSTSPNANHNCTEHHRLQVAIAMRHPYEATSVYNYQPSHKILNEICMLIQTKTFVIQKSNHKVMEIPKCEYDSANQNHIIVREIAFGPLCSPSDRPLALWFDIPDDDVEECTPKEILRLKRTERKLADKKKQLLLVKADNATGGSNKQLPPRIPHSTPTRSTSRKSTMTYAQIMSNKNNVKSPPAATFSVTRSSFDDTGSDFQQEFLLYCPKDEAAYQFVTETLQHRVNALDPTNDTQDIALKYSVLERKHASLMRHFGLFHWPVNKARSVVTKHTPIPKIDTRYEVPIISEDGKEEDMVMDKEKNEIFHSLWTSFLGAAENEFSSSMGRYDTNSGEKRVYTKKRLQVFVDLSQNNESNHW